MVRGYDAYVSYSATFGVDDELVIRNVIFVSEVAVKVIVPAPLPDFSTAPLPALTTCHEPMVPLVPEGSRMTIRDTVLAVLHLIEMSPVDPVGDQYVLRLPSRTSP